MNRYVILEWDLAAAEMRACDVCNTAEEAEENAVKYSYRNKALGGLLSYEVHKISYDTMTWATPEDL
jgi:hypothetical protein